MPNPEQTLSSSTAGADSVSTIHVGSNYDWSSVSFVGHDLAGFGAAVTDFRAQLSGGR